MNGLERPVGNALTNGIPANGIPQNSSDLNKKGAPQFTNEPSPGATSETVIAVAPTNSISQAGEHVNGRQ